MRRLRSLLLGILLGGALAAEAMPVFFSMQSLVEGQAINNVVTIHPAYSYITDGTNLFFCPTIQFRPVNGTNTINLRPNAYFLIVAGMNFGIPFAVPTPDSTNVVNFISLTTNLVTYLYTNYPPALLSGSAITSAVANAVSALTANVALAVQPNSYVTNLLVIDNYGNLLLSGDGNNNFFAGGAGNQTIGGTGAQNTGVGLGALSLVTGVDFNSAFGYAALGYNTVGEYNTAIGAQAINYNVSGDYNVAVGYNALEYLGSVGGAGGDNDIAFGYNSGTALTGNESGDIDIGNVGVLGENNIIRIGTPGTQTDTYLTGIVHVPGGMTTNVLFSFGTTNRTMNFTNGILMGIH